MTYQHDGELFLVGSFTSTVARFVSADLEDGAKDALGTTVFDLTDGRSVLDFISYERDEQMYVVALVSNFLFDGEPGAIRLDGELFYQSTSINDESPIIVDFSGNPLVPGVERAYDLDLAQKVARRGDEHAIVLRANSLFTEELP
jgi:hypothetical protein